MKVYHHSFLFAQDLIQDANAVMDANSVNAFKARLDKFWLHQKVILI